MLCWIAWNNASTWNGMIPLHSIGKANQIQTHFCKLYLPIRNIITFYKLSRAQRSNWIESKNKCTRTHWSEENKSWNTFQHNDCILFQEFHKQMKSYQLDMANEFINNFQNYKLLKGNHLKSNTSKQIVKTYVRSGVTFKFSSNSDCSFFFFFGWIPVLPFTWE